MMIVKYSCYNYSTSEVPDVLQGSPKSPLLNIIQTGKDIKREHSNLHTLKIIGLAQPTCSRKRLTTCTLDHNQEHTIEQIIKSVHVDHDH